MVIEVVYWPSYPSFYIRTFNCHRKSDRYEGHWVPVVSVNVYPSFLRSLCTCRSKGHCVPVVHKGHCVPVVLKVNVYSSFRGYYIWLYSTTDEIIYILQNRFSYIPRQTDFMLTVNQLCKQRLKNSFESVLGYYLFPIFSDQPESLSHNRFVIFLTSHIFD